MTVLQHCDPLLTDTYAHPYREGLFLGVMRGDRLRIVSPVRRATKPEVLPPNVIMPDMIAISWLNK